MRFNDDRITCGKCRGCFPTEQNQGIVEWQDDDDCAQWLLDAEVKLTRYSRASQAARFMARQLSIIVDRRGTPDTIN
jgi:hypothetical protein